MTKLLTILAVLVLGVSAALPARAQAMDTSMSDCSMMVMSGDMGGTMDMTTIQSLRTCVVHCYDMGYIKSGKVETALLQILDAAQASLDRKNTTAATKSLNAFILLVGKQPGTIIDRAHADCLVMHARMVVQALGG